MTDRLELFDRRRVLAGRTALPPADRSHGLLRRRFLTTSASGLGGLALASLLAEDGLLAGDPPSDRGGPLTPRATHFVPRAKRCIFLFMAGAPSQIDLFDPKPKLRELHGQPLPDSMTKDIRFAFIRKESATLLGSPRTFSRHGASGMEFSDLLPRLARHADDIAMVRSLHTDAFNHHPGQLLMNTGVPLFGRPSAGSWLTYGLGSECRDLPGYVVLTSGRGSSGGTSNWSSGFLPSSYGGVVLREQGEPILHIASPPGLSRAAERASLDAIRDLNRERLAATGAREIESRIAAYELAWRMQSAAPQLVDLSTESSRTLERYGVDRIEPSKGGRGYTPGVYASYARNCLLARRLVERGVRFVNIYHASWDQHSNLDSELAFNAGLVDQPIAALLADLEERGLLESTLVVWASEFGRTPLGENRPGREPNTGRDHHPFAFTVLLAGGGIRGGLTYGATDEIGWHVAEKPIHVNDLHATLLHLFGLDHLRLTYRVSGRDFRLTDVAGRVVHGLIA